MIAAIACCCGSAGDVRSASLLTPTPTLTVTKSSATGGVVLSWSGSAGSFSVMRSPDAHFFGGRPVQLLTWGNTGGGIVDPVLADGQAYFYSVEQDDAAAHQQQIDAMLAHASAYGDPSYYVAPGVFDPWVEVFRGHHIATPFQNQVASVTLAQCALSDCDATIDTICIADPDGRGPATATDVDGDGFDEFAAGDVVFVGSAAPGSGWDPKHLAHPIAEIRDGDRVNCPAGVKNQWRLSDRIVPIDEHLVPGAPITNIWLNWSHPLESGFFLLGYKLGFASRAAFGSHGPELLPVGETGTSCSIPQQWMSDDGGVQHPLAVASFPDPQSASPLQCTAGDGGGDCLFYSAPYPGWVESAEWIPVQPGDRYVVSGFVSPSTFGTDYTTLVTDSWTPGREAEIPSTGFTFDDEPDQLYLDRQFGGGWGNWFWTTATIPAGVHRVKVRYVKGDDAADVPLLDAISLKRLTEAAADDAKPGGTANFLINDPGSRTVLITGDSWAQPVHAIGQGLTSALAERYPGESFNVVTAGLAGKRASNILAEWDTMVAPYDPLYVVFVVGTNDCTKPDATPEDQFIANVTRLAMKSIASGAIPIFVGVSPTTWVDGSAFETCHAMRDRERRALLSLAP